jgi:hypothetical protein
MIILAMQFTIFFNIYLMSDILVDKKATDIVISPDRSDILFLLAAKQEKIKRRAGQISLKNPKVYAPK